MKPNACLEDRVLLMARMGFSNSLPTTLPLCLAHAAEETLKTIEMLKQRVDEALSDQQDWRWPTIAWIMKASERPFRNPPTPTADDATPHL